MTALKEDSIDAGRSDFQRFARDMKDNTARWWCEANGEPFASDLGEVRDVRKIYYDHYQNGRGGSTKGDETALGHALSDAGIEGFRKRIATKFGPLRLRPFRNQDRWRSANKCEITRHYNRNTSDNRLDPQSSPSQLKANKIKTSPETETKLKAIADEQFERIRR